MRASENSNQNRARAVIILLRHIRPDRNYCAVLKKHWRNSLDTISYQRFPILKHETSHKWLRHFSFSVFPADHHRWQRLSKPTRMLSKYSHTATTNASRVPVQCLRIFINGIHALRTDLHYFFKLVLGQVLAHLLDESFPIRQHVDSDANSLLYDPRVVPVFRNTTLRHWDDTHGVSKRRWAPQTARDAPN